MLSPCVVITFEEADVSTPHPACIPALAAAMAHGFRLADDGYPNHQDVLTGVSALRDFRYASRSKVSRFITFRFRDGDIMLDDAKIGVQAFIAACQSDAFMQATCQKHPRYEHWMAQLRAKLAAAVRSLAPTEHDAYDRRLVVPMGGDSFLMERFDRIYQG